MPIIDFSNSHEAGKVPDAPLLNAYRALSNAEYRLSPSNIRLLLFRADLTTGPMVVEMGPTCSCRYEVKDMTMPHSITVGEISWQHGESINQESWALQGVRVLDRPNSQTCRIGSSSKKRGLDAEKLQERSKLYKEISISRQIKKKSNLVAPSFLFFVYVSDEKTLKLHADKKMVVLNSRKTLHDYPYQVLAHHGPHHARTNNGVVAVSALVERTSATKSVSRRDSSQMEKRSCIHGKMQTS